MEQGRWDAFLHKIRSIRDAREASHTASMGIVAQVQEAIDEAKKLGASEAQMKPVQDVVLHYRDNMSVVSDAVVTQPGEKAGSWLHDKFHEDDKKTPEAI